MFCTYFKTLKNVCKAEACETQEWMFESLKHDASLMLMQILLALASNSTFVQGLIMQNGPFQNNMKCIMSV